MVKDLIEAIVDPEFYGFYGLLGSSSHIITIFCILAIGGLLVEYMNDGTIYNKAFNILCAVLVVLPAVLIVLSFISASAFGYSFVILGAFSNLSRLAMVFLFTFFAYDSAKAQLAKTDL